MICKALNLGDLPALTALVAQYPELNWRPAMLETSLISSQNQSFGLFDAGHLMSFALFQVVLDEAELLLLATQRAQLNKQYATRLLEWVLPFYPQVFLEVRASHIAARHLYEKLGFHLQRVRKNYYATPVEDAIQYLIKNK